MDSKSSSWYVEPEIQTPFIALLVILVAVESIFVGWGFHAAFSAAQDWRHPHVILHFTVIMLLTLLPMIALNFAAGLYCSFKIAGPLNQMRRAMGEIAGGNLDAEVAAQDGDWTYSLAKDFNEMLTSLRRVIYRDYTFVRESDEILTACQKTIKDGKNGQAGFERAILEVKSRLSIIDAHFKKHAETK
jgi:methyl-accepting chemotaxis protein